LLRCNHTLHYAVHATAMKNLLYLAISLFDSAEQLDPLTRKFSLFN
jgi:hypothetical protein